MARLNILPLSDAFISSPDELAEAIKIDLQRGCTKPALELLEWLFAVSIGKTDEFPMADGTQKLFNEALARVKEIANNKKTDITKGLKDL